MFKRFFDVVVAGAALLALAPLLALIAFLVRLDSPGRALFIQERLGWRGVVFRIWKFRTMRDAPDTGAVALPGDSRVTRLGAFLRRMHLDELPQLVNVLRGEMSLVGPRPIMAKLAEEYGRQDPHYYVRLGVRPGITGLAQLKGRMKSIEFGPRFTRRCDELYMRRQSMRLDLWIIACTISHALQGKGI